LGYTYTTETVSPAKISLVPILRSGLSMIDALTSLLPSPVPIHHLGMYRSKPTFEPIEYYNNLPYHRTSSLDAENSTGPSELAIVVDPVIATGATATAAVETLRDWGVQRVLVICILGNVAGVKKVAESWEGCVEVWCGGCDEGTDEKGMIKPGLGDVGDRLYLTIGK
jgi:uracil phosphoribosyltransferase